MVTESDAWAWDKFTSLLPVDLAHRISTLHGIHSGLGSDVVGLCAGKDGEFSVRSAYAVRWGPSVPAYDGLWKCINKFRGLQRVEVFLWLMCRDRVMTNVERLRRHFATDASCLMYGFRDETISHLFRSCLVVGNLAACYEAN
ncbi:hypothetical protein V6N13_024675 [Hibiscus sabdariffa]